MDEDLGEWPTTAEAAPADIDERERRKKAREAKRAEISERAKAAKEAAGMILVKPLLAQRLHAEGDDLSRSHVAIRIKRKTKKRRRRIMLLPVAVLNPVVPAGQPAVPV